MQELEGPELFCISSSIHVYNLTNISKFKCLALTKIDGVQYQIYIVNLKFLRLGI